VATDPAPFLSTVILASAALVAIIGGLLVGRFVSIDSEQQGSQKLLDDASGRLDRARERAEEARKELRRRRCHDFLGHPFVLDHIDRKKTDPEGLRGLAATGLTDDELKHLVSEVQAEFKRAREALRAKDTIDLIRGHDTELAAAALGDLNTNWPVSALM
jgi:hypothetical protein